jgi:DNA topoisomerase-1
MTSTKHRKHTPKKPAHEPPSDPQAQAKAVKLAYVSDAEPGIKRKRKGNQFIYIGHDGRRIGDAPTLERIRQLVIPPMWKHVWICANPNGHIQVTARDSRGRKQYRYHPRWLEVTGETKFEHMLEFGAHVPQIRRRVERDLALKELPRERVLAAVVALLGSTFIRVGNDEYMHSNESFGLTTLRDKHVTIQSSTIHFEFRGKSGKEHAIDLKDPRLARIIQRAKDVPGRRLFQYVDEQGKPHSVSAADVNAYLQETTAQPFTTKDFRTWGGTLLAARALAGMDPTENQKQVQRNVVQMYRDVAAQLGNTIAVCKKYYVHPAVVGLYQRGVLHEWLARHGKDRSKADGALDAIEQALLDLPRG